MQFQIETAELFIPDAAPEAEALARTTHLAIGAHQDDLEIMACSGILECFQERDKWFAGVVVTDGSGSARSGPYADYTDAEMMQVRRKEQKKAALLGEFGAQFLLDYPSKAVKSGADGRAVTDLAAILEATRPEVVYTHNLMDKHDTHVGVALKTIAALRACAPEARPARVYGCEVWRDLDWMVDADKAAFDVSRHEALQMALLGVFDSQIAGGKRYDLATMGRRKAHATYFESHGVDAAAGIVFAMDLAPLAADPALDPLEFALAHIARFADDVRARFARVGH